MRWAATGSLDSSMPRLWQITVDSVKKKEDGLKLPVAMASLLNGQHRLVSDAKNVAVFTWGHPANRRRRLRALCRAMHFQIRGRILHKPTLAQLGGQSKILAILHRTSSAKVLYANPPDYREMLVWQHALGPGDIFIDVGSNVGVYAIWAAEKGAHVVALEPAQDTYQLLIDNINLNQYDIDAINAAAGPACGTTRFTSGQDSANHFDPGGTIEIPVVALDSIIGDRTIAGLKIDVEGFELDVLRGCPDALSQNRILLIQLEWNSTSVSALGTDRHPLANLLSAYGYGLYRPAGNGALVPLADLNFGSDVFARPHASSTDDDGCSR